MNAHIHLIKPNSFIGILLYGMLLIAPSAALAHRIDEHLQSTLVVVLSARNVYLINAELPTSEAIHITRQMRNATQSNATIEFTVSGVMGAAYSRTVVSILMAILCLLGWMSYWHRRASVVGGEAINI